MKTSHIILTVLLASAPLAGCGGEANVADCEEGKKQVPCSERTKEEEARKALDDGDLDSAIALLTELIAEEPDNYGLNPLLGAAYASRAGFDILNVAKSKFASGGSLIEQMTSFLPDPADKGAEGYDLSLGDMKSSVDVLRLIPSDKLADTTAEKYAASAVLQLTLYQAAYSIMYLNKFAISATTGQVDLDQLATMTDEDALIILENLAAAGQIPGSEDPALQQRVNEALADIRNQDGNTDRDRLRAFVEKEQAPPQ